MSTPLSIPAETFLLLTGDTGRQKHTQFRKYVIAGAALIELALRERITMSDEKNPRITLTDPTPPETRSWTRRSRRWARGTASAWAAP